MVLRDVGMTEPTIFGCSRNPRKNTPARAERLGNLALELCAGTTFGELVTVHTIPCLS